MGAMLEPAGRVYQEERRDAAIDRLRWMRLEAERRGSEGDRAGVVCRADCLGDLGQGAALFVLFIAFADSHVALIPQGGNQPLLDSR